MFPGVERYAVIQEALTFDDVLLVPTYSEVLPAEVNVTTQITRRVRLNLPILSAAMDTVTETAMARRMAALGGLGVIHKNLEPAAQAAMVADVKATPVLSPATSALDARGRLLAAAAVGPSRDLEERIAALVAAGADVIVVDTAHGHSKGVISAVALVKKAYPQVDVVGGNIATAEAARALIDAGADAVKVGIGPGSICTTRIVAGVGVPQLTAIREVAAEAGAIPVIADGGIRMSGDICKALAAGASTVMLGGLLAATDMAPGEHVTIDGREYKRYRGMGSLGAMVRGSKDRYGQAGAKDDKLVAEGVEGAVAYKGELAAVLYQLVGGLRASMGYLGAPDLHTFRKNARFVRISSAGLSESHVHDIQMMR